MKNLLELQKHKSYRELLSKLESIGDKAATLTVKTVEVGGIPYTLQDLLAEKLTLDLDSTLIYAERDAQEIRRYFGTLQSISFREHSLDSLRQLLVNHNFRPSLKVSAKGEFSVSGDILNFWSPGYDHPVRVSFLGDEFEFAEIYDEIYGRSFARLHQAIVGDIKQIEEDVVLQYVKIANPDQQYYPVALIFGGDNLDTYESQSEVNFDFSYPQLFFQRFDLLEGEIDRLASKNYQIKLLTAHKDALPNSLLKYVSNPDQQLEAGIESAELKIFFLTDRELFGTVFLSRSTKRLTSKEGRQMLAELEGEIEIGNPVVHEDHGIGIYKGLKQEQFKQDIPLGFNKFKTKIIYEDYLLIAYAEGDELYVPLSQIDKITKYIAADDFEPRITRLGKSEWNKLKIKVKASIASIAKELVEHYAKRTMAKAQTIPQASSQAFQKFLHEFPYHETADQLRTEKDIYKDLAGDKPMNRLIVGDVGFGKTEMAMRAAYLVAEAGMQVAVLCPTTVLAAQHLKVFTDRFKTTSFKVASMSRFSKADNKSIAEGIKAGKTDIVIGTHRLLSTDIEFKKLGLIVIDEEQKFGVKQKEKLKQLEYGAHILTLSATPIPRTLSMALSSIQEVSIIQTPPEGRKQVKTFVAKHDKQKIVNAIAAEVNRDGQVYYLHNRVSTILSVYRQLQLLLPGVRFIYGHGQLEPEILEKTIGDFYNGKYDVLICSTIIENGIDMPNVNTIIIEQAQNFGLGQLYQLRGRVGRGERQAYAYLFYEGEDPGKKEAVGEGELDEKLLKQKRQHQKYKERLKAILELQELGSGFRLASRDLEIRGAGNLLGREQHGNIRYIGYGLYMQLLAGEIERLKSLNRHLEKK